MNLPSPNIFSTRRFHVSAKLLMPALLALAAGLAAPAALAQAAAASSPIEQAVSYPAIPGVVIKEFAFGVFHDLNAPSVRLDPMLEVTRNDTSVGWVIKLDTQQPTVRWREEFTTPVPPQNWGLKSDTNDTRPPSLSADQQTATVERRVSGKGDISHHWTLHPDDPAGPHTMRVWVEDVLVATVKFSVK